MVERKNRTEASVKYIAQSDCKYDNGTIIGFMTTTGRFRDRFHCNFKINNNNKIEISLLFGYYHEPSYH